MLERKISDFSYNLPYELIALTPPKTRGASRLLVLHRPAGRLEHQSYGDFIDYIQPGDVVVLNDAKGQKRELLLGDHHNNDLTKRRCTYRGTIKAGKVLSVDGTPVTITKVDQGGLAEIAADINLLDLAEHEGSVPLPPYIRREATAEDIMRYQTIFAKRAGSVAAPTASLNITQGLLDAIVAKNATVTYITLHVGLGTFLPIRTDNIEQHNMHSEYFEIPEAFPAKPTSLYTPATTLK